MENKGKFKPGNPGKPPGAKNKVNSELRVVINNFLNDEFDTIKEDFKKLDPKDKLKFYTDLLNYGLPKLQATSFELDFEKLSESELDLIIDGLIKRSNNE